jgi:hypothetical protein
MFVHRVTVHSKIGLRGKITQKKKKKKKRRGINLTIVSPRILSESGIRI